MAIDEVINDYFIVLMCFGAALFLIALVLLFEYKNSPASSSPTHHAHSQVAAPSHRVHNGTTYNRVGTSEPMESHRLPVIEDLVPQF